MMQKYKKSFFCFLAAFSIIAFSFNASAQEIGTYDEGIITKKYQLGKLDATDGLQNGDFSDGFQYWGSFLEGGPSKEAKLVTENGNTYVQLTPQGDYTGLASLNFVCNEYEVGDRAIVIYDWKGSENHQVYLCQVAPPSDLRIGNGPNELIKEATGSGWNTSITKVTGEVLEPRDGYFNKTFYLGLQCTTDMSADTAFDNIRMGILEDDGTVKDLQGNIVGKSEQLSEENPDESEPSESAVSEEPEENDVAEVVSDAEDTVKEEKNDNAGLIVLIVAIVLFVLADIALFVRIILKKKKSKQ